MDIQAIIERRKVPAPWSEGEHIPWNEPGFSARMLREHLSQEHDAASRRFEIIDTHVSWIHTELLGGQQGSILDLGCGPGLYASRLARLGHTCLGIDFSPASIQYARETAASENLACRYIHGDLRQADFGSNHRLAMLIYGELNIFQSNDAGKILTKAFAALAPGGILLLEPHTEAYVQRMGQAAPSWYSSHGGLFSEIPHLCLLENSWDADVRAATTRYFVLDGSGEVYRYAESLQAYSDAGYSDMLTRSGFGEIQFYPSLGFIPGAPDGLFALTARKLNVSS